MTGMSEVAILDCGDSAIRAEVRSGPREDAWRLVHGLAASHGTDPLPGVRSMIATYDALLVELDTLTTSHLQVRTALAERVPAAHAWRPADPRHFRIPVLYGGDFAADLSAVAQVLGISEQAVIDLHSAKPLVMRCFGSPAGAPMLDGPGFAQPIPRLATPRPHVVAGAVAVAGRQAVISARPAPGGWHVLGRTPMTLVDIADPELMPYRPGDTFEFFAIDADRWDEFAEVQLHA